MAVDLEEDEVEIQPVIVENNEQEDVKGENADGNCPPALQLRPRNPRPGSVGAVHTLARPTGKYLLDGSAETRQGLGASAHLNRSLVCSVDFCADQDDERAEPEPEQQHDDRGERSVRLAVA